MADTTISDADIADMVSRLRTGKDQVDTQLRELQTAVRNLVQAGFRTPSASQAFEVKYDELTNGITEAVNGVEGMAAFLEQTMDAYGTTDTDLASRISGS